MSTEVYQLATNCKNSQKDVLSMAALHAGVNATAFIAHALAVPPPINLVTSPAGKYGISYDIFTRALEDPLPNGWARRRCMLKLNLNCIIGSLMIGYSL